MFWPLGLSVLHRVRMAEDQGSASRSRSASGNDAREDVVAAAFTECIYSGQIRDNSGSSSPVNPPLDRASTMLPPHPSAASIDGMNDYFHQALQLTAPSAQQTHAVETRDWRCVNNLLNHHDRACWECPSSSYPPLPSSSVSDVPAEKIDDQRKEMTPAEHPPGQQETQTQVTSSLSKRRKSLQNRIKKFSLHRQGRKSSPSSAPGTKKTSSSSGTKSRSWGGVFRLNCSFGGSWSPTIDERSRSSSPSPQEPSSGGAVPNPTNPACVCTGYRRLEDEVNQPFSPVIDLSRFNPEEFPIEDFDERARMERAREIDEGVDPPPGFVVPFSFSDSMSPGIDGALTLVTASSTSNGNAVANFPFCCARSSPPLSSSTSSLVAATGFSTETRFESFFSTLDGDCTLRRTVHTQVDYVHCLVPDLLSIANFPFYWGKMDRYEAERLLENKAEGTFLLRDSAQEDYFFSVSFRRYGRSLHARIEQWNHMFSFDSHDPSVFSAPAVSQLMDHYKDPSSCMFFEPLLTSPLNRNFAFPLQHLCRAVVCSNTTYDGINQLKLPKTLKAYLREYHYKQKLRVRRFQVEH